MLLEKGIKKMRAKEGVDLRKKHILGLNMVNIGIYFVYFLCNKKIDFFENEKFYKLRKKLNESLSSDKSKHFKDLSKIITNKLNNQEKEGNSSKDFKEWVKLKLPFSYEEFEIIELKNLIESVLDFRNRSSAVTIKESNVSKITRLVFKANQLFFYTESDPNTKFTFIVVSNNIQRRKSRVKSKSLRNSERTSQRNRQSSEKRKNIHLMMQQKEEKELKSNSNSGDENNKQESVNSDIADQDNEENHFRLNNRVFREFISQLDKDYNYYNYHRKTETEDNWAKLTPNRLNIEIWSFNLFAYSLEKIKKCKICKAFLPDYLCENALDIVPYFSENRNNKGLIK
jgi:hypothetical protein